MQYINVKHIKELAKQYDRRVGKEFLALFDTFVEQKIRSCCETHNGSKKTLDVSVAIYNGIKVVK